MQPFDQEGGKEDGGFNDLVGSGSFERDQNFDSQIAFCALDQSQSVRCETIRQGLFFLKDLMQ